MEGSLDGDIVGSSDGENVGETVGREVGLEVGSSVGMAVGETEGISDGENVGSVDGEIVGEKPKVAVMMIGTNNIGHGSSDAAATALGVKTIVGKLRTAMPATKILLLGIFPRGATATDKMRMDVASATAQFSSLADGKNVFFLDIGRAYVSKDGDMWKGLMPDLLHPNPAGYEIWAKAMEPTLKNLLGE
jgi:beta-glucosidase